MCDFRRRPPVHALCLLDCSQSQQLWSIMPPDWPDLEGHTARVTPAQSRSISLLVHHTHTYAASLQCSSGARRAASAQDAGGAACAPAAWGAHVGRHGHRRDEQAQQQRERDHADVERAVAGAGRVEEVEQQAGQHGRARVCAHRHAQQRPQQPACRARPQVTPPARCPRKPRQGPASTGAATCLSSARTARLAANTPSGLAGYMVLQGRHVAATFEGMVRTGGPPRRPRRRSS